MVETAQTEQGAQNVEKSEAQGIESSTLSEAAESRSSRLIEQYNLPDNYKINVNTPLSHLNSGYGKAFDVSDSNQNGDFYAIVLQNTIPIRFDTIQKLKKVYHSNFCNVVDSGFVNVASGKYGNFAVITEKPKGESLTNFMEAAKRETPQLQKGKIYFEEDFLANEIVAPLNELIKVFGDSQVSHGLINHNNVYIESLELGQGKLKLREPISEPCGFSQYHQYEPVHRAQSMPIGKGETTYEEDYFALGVLIFYMLFGELPEKDAKQPSIIDSRLEKGTYSTYLKKPEIPHRMIDLLRGLLNDSNADRWGYEDLQEWVQGKGQNVVKPTIRKEAARAYVFAGGNYNNTKSLANKYYQKWEDSSEDIRSKRLSKWLELSVNRSISADDVNNALAGTGNDKSKSRKEDDELVAKTLVILDPQAPIRYRNLATHIDGLGAVLANAWMQQNQLELQTFTEILRLNLADFKAQRDLLADNNADRWLLQKLHSFITIKSYGFGVERCLYDLNSTYPCQSNLLSKSFIIDIKQLVYFLNDNADNLKDFDPVDRHIGAFIASKLDLSQEINIDFARRFKSKEIKELIGKMTLLSYAQARADIPRVNKLCGWLVSRMGGITKTIKSQKLKKQFVKELDKVASNGNVRSILDFLAKGQYFEQDDNGYKQAKKEYLAYNHQLGVLTDTKQKKARNKLYYHNGLYIAKVVAVLVFIFILSMTFFKSG